MTVLLTAVGFATFQDDGRHGYTDSGVPTSGAADRRSYAEACWLVDSPASTAIELFGPVSLVVEQVVQVAYAGVDADLSVNGRTAPTRSTLRLSPGDRLDVRPATAGGVGYLATPDGWDADPILGSTSTDTLSGLGPAALCAGQRLTAPGRVVEHRARRGHTRSRVVHLCPGPYADLFPPAVFEALAEMTWTIGPGSSRAGLRLAGGCIPHNAPSLASLPMLDGAIQLTPAGQPIVLGPDHGTLGGYPVIGMVDRDGLDSLYRLRQGATFTFTRAALTATPARSYLLDAL